MGKAVRAIAGVILVGVGAATSWSGGGWLMAIGWNLLLGAPAEAMAPPR